MIPRDDLLEAFLEEGRELVARGNTELADGVGGVDGLFRTLHTLKGSAALFDLPRLTALLHAAETLLELARPAGALSVEERDRVGRVLDVTERWLEVLDAEQDIPDGLDQQTLVLTGDVADRELDTVTPEPSGQAAWAQAYADAASAPGVRTAIRYAPDAQAFFRGDDPLAIMRGLPGLAALKLETTEAAAPGYDPFRCGMILTALSTAHLSDVRAAMRLVADQTAFASVSARAPASKGQEAAVRSLRIDAGRLDEVAALVDQLVIVKNSILSGGGDAGSRTALDRVVKELHASVIRLRLVTLNHLFARFPRQVREISEALGKQIELRITGEQVVLDKAIVEGLFEPLLHLVRNALDHGIELPATRRSSGKSERATLTLAAQALGGEVTIEIMDDGAGIDLSRVRQTAVQRGILDAEAAAALGDADVAELIFSPGFSTAKLVGDLSGRGVGMDAVRAAIALMGGRIALDNQPGHGLTVRITLPAQITLGQALIVASGGERFGAPIADVSEVHRVRREDVHAIRAGRAFVHRGRVTPLLRLSDVLGLAASPDPDVFPVLLIDAGGEPVGLQVDAVGEQIEAPLRPMTGLMARFPGVQGTMLQGDGRVLLVLDVAELTS